MTWHHLIYSLSRKWSLVPRSSQEFFGKCTRFTVWDPAAALNLWDIFGLTQSSDNVETKSFSWPASATLKDSQLATVIFQKHNGSFLSHVKNVKHTHNPLLQAWTQSPNDRVLQQPTQAANMKHVAYTAVDLHRSESLCRFTVCAECPSWAQMLAPKGNSGLGLYTAQGRTHARVTRSRTPFL